jgi:hypothetical protein
LLIEGLAPDLFGSQPRQQFVRGIEFFYRKPPSSSRLMMNKASAVFSK